MLQVPLEISFHGTEPTPWAEEQIRTRLAKLVKLYERLVSCRVRVDQRATNSGRTIPPVVHVELGLPGHKDIMLSHEPDHLWRKFRTPDLHNAINEAFRIAEDRLAEFKAKLDDTTKEGLHDRENRFLGQVTEVTPEEDFGFLMTNEGGLLYFHRNSLMSGEFDALKPGAEVYYVEEMGDTGPIASKVRVRA